MKRWQHLIISLILIGALAQPLWGRASLAADPTPTSPPPPDKPTQEKPPPSEPGNPKPPKKTATPTPRPTSGSYRTPTPTLTVTPAITATATLTPTLTPSPTPVPGELHITVYMDENRNNLMDDGEGVENLLLTASAGSWKAQAWTVAGVAVMQIPAEFYGSKILVQCPYLHWGETFAAPEADAAVAEGVLRLTKPDYPVFLP